MWVRSGWKGKIEMIVTLGEFVKQLAIRMEDANLVMLFKDEAPWHLLFYKLKKDQSPGKPKFLATLRFDWDGPYPRCQELSDFIQALHWTGSVVAVNPSYEKIMLQDGLKEIWSEEGKSLEPELRSFLEKSVELAKEEFPQAA
jgi:hypothetical protein